MRRLLTLLAAVLLVEVPAHAQAPPSARDVISFLMTTQRVATGDFIRDQQAAEAARDTITRALLIEMATAAWQLFRSVHVSLQPGYRNGGTRHPELRPALREPRDHRRPPGDDVGRVPASDFVHSRPRFDERLLVTTANKFRDETTPFDVESLSLALRMQTTTLFGNYGVTDWMDVSVAVPLVRLCPVSVNTYRGASVLQATGSATSSGW
jgi:hypothetical protein